MARFLLLAASLVCLSIYCANAETLQGFRAKTLSAFNAKRKANGLSQVTYSSTLNNLALDWAKSLVNSGSFRTSNQHSGGKFVWELIFAQYGERTPNMHDMVNSWMEGDTRPTMVHAGFKKMGFGIAYKNGVYKMVGMWQ